MPDDSQIPAKDEHRNEKGNAMFTSSAGQCLAPHARVLRAAGFLRRCGGGSAADRWHRAYRRAVLLLTGAYLLQETVYALRARNDMEKLSRVMFLLLCHVTSIAKQIVFYAEADRIDEVLRNLDAPLLAGSSAGGAARLTRTAAAARRLLVGYAGCAVVVCHLWLALTLLARAAGQPVEFSFWTGFDTQPLVVFVPCLLYSHYVITLVGIANTTMDGFMATILYLCKTQLEILREDLRTLPERARSAAAAAGEQHEAMLLREFVHCFRHYQAVTEIATSFQDIFGLAIFIQVGVGSGILCMAAYKMASLSVASAEFASMLLFIACILTELFLYCYYGNELKVESGLVASAAYSMRWVGLSARARRLLLLLLLRAGRDLSPAAAGLVPLSLETYVKIIKSSYTFFAVLRQTK